MEDRDGKKPFIIPKTRTSTKDVLISEKTDSRNVLELFDDIKSCALEVHFNFRQNECKSCDTIRNPKLQKLYNEKRAQMRKTQDPTERFAFHLIKSRDMALTIATDGLTCEQLSFSVDKYLGNPKDGIHLSRRPDVLLASSGAQGICTFGLLICKVLLGKGYTTIPSINNKELSAQIHYDHHFCKIQPVNKEQRHIDNLLANSLIFCYEHEDFQTLSRPSQILPIAILWYDLKEKFSSELTITTKESQQKRNAKNIKAGISYKTKPSTKPPPSILPKPKNPPISSSTIGAWADVIQDPTIISIAETTPKKQPNQVKLPYSYPSLYTSFSNQLQSTNSRDPRLMRANIPSETIPLSAQKSALEQSQSDISLSVKEVNIPLDSTIPLPDPRSKISNQTRTIFYLEVNAVKHALQQQKRLNNYYDLKSGLMPRTSYTLIPFQQCSIPLNENESLSNNSSHIEYLPLNIAVIDCLNFGFIKTANQSYVDLEEYENQFAYDQIKISNHLSQRAKQLNLQERRLRLSEKRQKRAQEKIEHNLSRSKNYVNNGRKFLQEHQLTTSSNNRISSDLFDFFFQEYHDANRPYVKRILAELVGVLIEKYDIEHKQIISNNDQNKEIEASTIDSQTISNVIDMELDSPCPQTLGDRDERFGTFLPSLITETNVNQPLPSLPLSTENELAQHEQTEVPISTSFSTTNKSESILPHDDIIFPASIDQPESSSTINDDSQPIINPQSSVILKVDSNHSRDEFVKLLTKEAHISKSPSPSKMLDERRQSYENDESSTNKALVPSNHEDSLIIETTKQNEDESTVQSMKVDLISLSNENVNSGVTTTDDHDYRQDLDDRRRQAERSRSRSTTSSIKELKKLSPISPATKNRYGQQRRKKHKRPRQRSSDLSYHYHQGNINNPNSPHSQSIRHQRFNYNHQPVAAHPRFANVDTIPSPTKMLNYNPFDTYNYPTSIVNYSNILPMNIANQNSLSSSYYNVSTSNYQDNYMNNPPQHQMLMSTTPAINLSNSYDLKPSNTIERLQMFLQNKTTTLYAHEQTPTTDYSSSSYTMNQPMNSNNAQWSSTATSDTIMQNNQSFTYTDAEQLLTFVQRLRN